MRGSSWRLRNISIGQSALKYISPNNGNCGITPVWTTEDIQGTHSQFKEFSDITSDVKLNGSNSNKFHHLLKNKTKLGLFDLDFNLNNGNDIQLFIELLNSNENLNNFKGIGTLMKSVSHSYHKSIGPGLDIIRFCGTSPLFTESIFKSLYSTKMKQITIDILVQLDPMECIKFLNWYKECEDFDQNFHSFSKFKLIQQQSIGKFNLPIQINDEDVNSIIKNHLGSYLTFLMSQPKSIYPSKEKFDYFLTIYFKSLEKFKLNEREIQKCNSQFLNFLVKNYDIEYNILLAYTLKLFPSASNYEILKNLKLIDSKLKYSVDVDQLPPVDVNVKIANNLSTIYLSDINLIYTQLLNHQHLNSTDILNLFNDYINLKINSKDNKTRGNNNPFLKHNSIILVTFLKYCKFELNDFQLAYKILTSYINRIGYSEFKEELKINKSHKHFISLILAKLCEIKLDQMSLFESKFDLIWDWKFYWSLIINSIKLSELGYANKIWDKVKLHPELWDQITKTQASTLLNLNFTFNKNLVLSIDDNVKKTPKLPITDENYLKNKLLPESVIKSLS